MFESLIPLFSIAMALMLGAISPGPSFIYVAQNSISKSRKHGLFTALLPKEIPNYYYVALPLICFMIDAGWYSCVAMLLSSEKPRKMYLKAKTGVDRVAGSIVSVLGLKLIFFK